MSSTLPVTPDILYRRADRLIFNQLDDDWLALDAEAGYFYGLNAVAGRIWALLQSPISLAALCAQLGQEYAVDPATCQADVIEVLQQLASADLIVAQSSPDATHAGS